jgi:hypothetical protein
MDVDFFEVAYQDLSSSWPVDCPTLESLDALALQDKAQLLGSYSLPLESGMRGAFTPMRVGIDPPSTQEGVCSIPPSSTVFSHVTYPTEFEFMMYPVTNENGAVEMAGPIAPPTQFAHQETGIQFTMLPDYLPDKDTIKLWFDAKVVSAPMWANVGSQVQVNDHVRGVPNMPLAYFHTRSVSTNLNLANGSGTVLCGGMSAQGNVLCIRLKARLAEAGDAPVQAKTYMQNPL